MEEGTPLKGTKRKPSGTPNSMDITPGSIRRTTKVSSSSSSPRPMSITPGSRSSQPLSKISTGTVLGVGTFACVVAGNICPGAQGHNMVSKVVGDKHEINTIANITDILNKLQITQEWKEVILHPRLSCTIQQVPPGCTTIESDTLKNFTLPLIVYSMPYGISLTTYLSNVKTVQHKHNLYAALASCFSKYVAIFHTLQKKQKTDPNINWLHGDINPNNIVILQSNGKVEARLIDYNPLSEKSTCTTDTEIINIEEVLVSVLKRLGLSDKTISDNYSQLLYLNFIQAYNKQEKERKAEDKRRAEEKKKAIQEEKQPIVRRITF